MRIPMGLPTRRLRRILARDNLIRHLVDNLMLRLRIILVVSRGRCIQRGQLLQANLSGKVRRHRIRLQPPMAVGAVVVELTLFARVIL